MSLLTKLVGVRNHVPDELYDIEPGQVAYFVHKEGLDRMSFNILFYIVRFFRALEMSDIRVRIIPTDNEILIGNIACRNIEETSIPYMIVIGPWETLIGLASKYYGVEGGAIWRKIKRAPFRGGSLSDELPLVVPINPDRRPAKQPIYNQAFSDDPGMELLQKRPETEKEKKDLVAKYEQKFRKMLWECAYLGIDLNINGIVEEVEINKTKTEGYGLSLQMTQDKTSGLIDCKVFVGDGLEMKVTAVRKAVYLAFLTLEDGLVIEEATPAFTKRIQNIYRQLPDREEKEEKEGGLLYVDYIQPKTLRGYMSDINSAIAKLVPNGLIAIELSIEGLKEEEFKVMRSTPEIRKQIIQAFNL
ncbi:MAG: hypothetical protein II659_00170 [Bacteroidales bacterium]|nr:hypothetical protein [Bacteroidales bacterium]